MTDPGGGGAEERSDSDRDRPDPAHRTVGAPGGDELWEEGTRELSRQGLRRELPSTSFFCDVAGSEGRLVLCSNDYLALSNDPRLKAAAVKATEESGCGSTGSRLLSGNSTYHAELEEELARFTGYETCLLFGSGYHANVGVIPAIAARLSLILSDELNHASIIDGCRLAQAKTGTYRHNDPAHLDELLSEYGGRPIPEGAGSSRALVITEGVFSMDGDVARLEELAAVTREHGALLMLDDAHAFGVLGAGGRGTPEEKGVTEGVDIYLGTMGKALGSMGGFIAGSRSLIDYLTSTSRSLLYSTALPPAACAAAGTALGIVESEGRRREDLRRLSSLLRVELRRGGFDTGRSESHIVPVMTKGHGMALDLARRLEDRGYLARAIRYPTVARGSERIRLSLRCDFQEEQMRGFVVALKEEGAALGLIAGDGTGGAGRSDE